MATFEDYEAVKRLWPKWADKHKISPQQILCCSGDAGQIAILSFTFRQATINNSTIANWNLDNSCPTRPDIIVACNVFHYSRTPFKWFGNCLASCKYLFLQDLFARQRGPDGKELSVEDSGDATRYGMGGVHAATSQPVFDLAEYKKDLLEYEVYDAGSMRAGRTMINFAALFKGWL